jgi:exonuclease III
MRFSSVICWNVAGRVARVEQQQQRIVELEPDLICLQEVRTSTLESWRRRLAEAGWHFALASDPSTALAAGRVRPLLTFIAARVPFEPIELAALPWPERALAVRVDGLELLNVHSPTSPKPGLAKVLTHELLAEHLAGGSGPRALCGDLNTPRKEHRDGRVWTFARDRYGRLRPERGERWDQAELALIRGLECHGFRDAFRALHGSERRELSWEWQRWGGGYRLDHLIVSDQVRASDVRYLHEWRREGLSDHSPLYATLGWPALEEVVARQHVHERHERNDRGDAPGELRDQAAGV